MEESFWYVSSHFKKIDGKKFPLEMERDEVIQKLQDEMKELGWDPYNLRWESNTDQIFGFIRYADGRWRRVINITP